METLAWPPRLPPHPPPPHSTFSPRSQPLLLPSSRLPSPFLCSNSHCSRTSLWQNRLPRRFAVRAGVLGENPVWSDDDYLVIGLAHCFSTSEDGKLKDVFVVEPIPAGALECMDNGGATCYTHTTATTLGIALQKDLSLLPKEFSKGSFCNEFDFRAKCASRTWKRDHPVENLMHLVPKDGVRSDYNFNLDSKRVLNAEHVVTDADNIKQDLSIDVYGRKKTEEDAQIANLYNA